MEVQIPLRDLNGLIRPLHARDACQETPPFILVYVPIGSTTPFFVAAGISGLQTTAEQHGRITERKT